MRIVTIIIGIAILGADLITKWWITKWWFAKPRSSKHYPIIERFFAIRYDENTGIAFGLLDDLESEWKPMILSGLALLAVVVVLYYIWTTPGGPARPFFALGLLLGGILGNCIDRLMNGYVVDFLKLHWGNRFAWPTFNVADAAITCGVILILFETFFGDNERLVPGDEGSIEPDQESRS